MPLNSPASPQDTRHQRHFLPSRSQAHPTTRAISMLSALKRNYEYRTAAGLPSSSTNTCWYWPVASIVRQLPNGNEDFPLSLEIAQLRLGVSRQSAKIPPRPCIIAIDTEYTILLAGPSAPSAPSNGATSILLVQLVSESSTKTLVGS